MTKTYKVGVTYPVIQEFLVMAGSPEEAKDRLHTSLSESNDFKFDIVSVEEDAQLALHFMEPPTKAIH